MTTTTEPTVTLDREQRTDWMEHVEHVWEGIMLRARARAGVDLDVDASGYDVYTKDAVPLLELEIKTGRFGFHSDPLAQVDQLKRFAACLQHEVEAAIERGEFLERVVDIEEAMSLRAENARLR